MKHCFNTKENIRSLQKEKLSKILLKSEKDTLILENLKPFLKNSKIIMIYNPLLEEPNLLKLNLYFKDILFVYPKIFSKERKQLVYVDWNSYQSTDLNRVHAISTDSIDIFILPALGYTEEGTRLGRGGGYFDRSLNGIDKKK